MEFKIIKLEKGNLEFNFEELKQDLKSNLLKFQGLIFTEDTMNKAKETRASLNKVEKLIDNERIRIKKEYCIPLNEFESQVKELTTLIKKTNKEIDDQIKMFEDKNKENKKNKIAQIWDTKNFELVELENIFNDKWLNSNITLQHIEKEIDEKIEKINQELSVISSIVEENEIYQSKINYLKNLDLGDFIAKYNNDKVLKEKLKKSTKNEEYKRIEMNYCNKNGLLCAKLEIYGTTNQLQELKTFLIDKQIKYKNI